MYKCQEEIVLKSTLYLVPTPIGNLEDITRRALFILKKVDLIVAEDTRHTGLLLKYFSINARLSSLNNHNEQKRQSILFTLLKQGKSIALVSDSGTPLINDPGYQLVRHCQNKGIRVIPLPGACSAITALSASGIPSNRFCYEGFLPKKLKNRLNYLQSIEKEYRTMIFYESPHRILKSLQDMIMIFGPKRYVVLARELTKIWESIHGTSLDKLLYWINEDKMRQRGEMILIVSGYKTDSNENLSQEILDTFKLLKSEFPLKKATTLVAKIHKIKKNVLYRYALEQNRILSKLNSEQT